MPKRVVGAVVEYNPFHNGHLHHIKEAKRLADADLSICVMSGHFLQRGEPALVDKWARAEMAVAAGVDLVLELPYAFAGQTAEVFASGATALLEATGVVTHLAFGSETTDLSLLLPVAKILATEPLAWQAFLRRYLTNGLAFPVARQKALLDYLEQDNLIPLVTNVKLQKFLSRPNTILGLEYLKALHRMNSSMQPLPIERIGAAYHDSQLTRHGIASATAIRSNLQNAWHTPLTWEKRRQTLLHLKSYIPASTGKILNREFRNGRGPVFPDHFSDLLQYALRRTSSEALAGIADVREGLEHRMTTAGRTAVTWDDFLDHLKSKRFPRTTLQRILIQILIGFTKNDAITAKHYGPAYLRVLGFSHQGQDLLRTIKKTSTLPVVHRPAVHERELRKGCSLELAAALRMLELDRLATDIYVLAFDDPRQRKSGQDYTAQPPIKPNQEERS